MFGLGLRKFSMNSANIARVKRTLSLFTLEEAENIAKTAQNLATEADVIAYVKAEVDKRS
jgi:phosphoenolpyruvate-protein kinase (PTS system EI component)